MSRRIIGSSVATIIVFLVVPSALEAHSAGYYAQGSYPGRPHQERAYFGGNAPAGAFRDRFLAAQKQWDDISNGFEFLIYTEPVDQAAPASCRADQQPTANGERASLIDYRYVDGQGGQIASTETCVASRSNRPEYFNLTVDQSDDFYFGRGEAPKDRIDLASTAVHELGHAAGFFYHYDDAETTSPGNQSICRNSSDQRTMCAKQYKGAERMRTLQDHDQDTHQMVYGG